MKFCTKCGKEVKEEQTFCTYCGNQLSNESTNKTQPIKQPIEETIEETKEETIGETKEETKEEINSTIELKEYPKFYDKLTQKSKIVIAVVTVLIVAIVVVVFIGNSLSDPKKLETRFQNDVISNNTTDLANILYCNDGRLTVTSSNISPLLDYFKNNPSKYDEVIQNLNNDVLRPKDISNLNIASSNTLTLTSVGKKFLLFPSYKINVKPSFVEITTTVKDVTFSINNNQIGKSDTDKSTKEFGPYIPGTYSILASYKGKYVTLNKPYPVDLMTTNNGIAKLSVFDDMNYLNITSDYPDAEIFVNAKDTNVKVKDAANFGPVDSSAKIYAINLVGGKTLKSGQYSATNGVTDINISFEDSSNALNDVKTQLNDLLGYYSSALAQAINTNNSSLIDPYVTPGSEFYKQQQVNIPGSYEGGDQESFIAANISSYDISDDSLSGSITTSESYNVITKDGISSNKTYNHVYKFQYNIDTASYQFIHRQ